MKRPPALPTVIEVDEMYDDSCSDDDVNDDEYVMTFINDVIKDHGINVEFDDNITIDNYCNFITNELKDTWLAMISQYVKDTKLGDNVDFELQQFYKFKTISLSLYIVGIVMEIYHFNHSIKPDIHKWNVYNEKLYQFIHEAPYDPVLGYPLMLHECIDYLPT